MNREELMHKTVDQVYEEVQRMIAKTSGKFERKLKDEPVVVAAYASALFLGMLGVLAYGRKLRGQFKEVQNHFKIKNKKEVIRATSEDACMLISGFLSGIDPDYNYQVQILKKNKK